MDQILKETGNLVEDEQPYETTRVLCQPLDLPTSGTEPITQLVPSISGFVHEYLELADLLDYGLYMSTLFHIESHFKFLGGDSDAHFITLPKVNCWV